MSAFTFRGILPFAGVLALLATAAAAQTAPASPTAAMSGMEQGGAMDAPVMDSRLFAHVLFDQFEGRMSGKTDFRWDGQGWLGTDYDKLWIKTEGFVRSNGTADDGRHDQSPRAGADGSHTTLPLISATISDGMTAIAVILAMSFGLIVPKMVIDRLSERWMKNTS